jgi:hypothetical protein
MTTRTTAARTTPKTAADAFAKADTDVAAQLERLQRGLDRMRAEAAVSPRNWGNAGTARHAANTIARLADMLLGEGEHAE